MGSNEERWVRAALLAMALVLVVTGQAQPLQPPIVLAPEAYLPMVLGTGLPPAGPPPPLLVDPPDGAVLDTLSPTFTLDNTTVGQPARAHLQFATDAALGSVVVEYYYARFQGQVTSRPYWNFEEGITYYWRARSEFDRVTWGTWSEAWSFRTPSGGVLPGTPTLLSPANGSTVDSLQVTLHWTAVPGATRYAVRVGSITYQPLSNEYTLFEDLEPDTIYTWHASARNDYGWGAQSETWSFRTPPGDGY